MQIGEYYFSKIQTLTLLLLVMGTVIGLALLQTEQIIKTRAAVSESFKIYQNLDSPQLVAYQGTYPIKTFDVTIESTSFENQPTAPIEAKVISPPTPAPKAILTPYIIPIRDTSIGVVNRDAVLNRPEALRFFGSKQKIEEKLNFVIDSAIRNGWNPAFITALWVEESGATTNIGYLSCMSSIEANLGCFYNDKLYQNMTDFGTFEKYWCGPNVVPICANNPDHLANLRSVYNQIVDGSKRVDIPQSIAKN